jgi:hypothetical protein
MALGIQTPFKIQDGCHVIIDMITMYLCGLVCFCLFKLLILHGKTLHDASEPK